MSNPELDALLDSFDQVQSQILALPKDPGIRRQFFLLMKTILPKIEPFLSGGIDVGMAAASGILGPMGPIFGIAAHMVEKAGVEGAVTLVDRELAKP